MVPLSIVLLGGCAYALGYPPRGANDGRYLAHAVRQAEADPSLLDRLDRPARERLRRAYLPVDRAASEAGHLYAAGVAAISLSIAGVVVGAVEEDAAARCEGWCFGSAFAETAADIAYATAIGLGLASFVFFLAGWVRDRDGDAARARWRQSLELEALGELDVALGQDGLQVAVRGRF